MKKLILLTLALLCQTAFSASLVEKIELDNTDNFISKDACMLNHFQNVAELVDLNNNSAKPTKNADVEKAINGKIKVVKYQNESKLIYTSIYHKGYYLVESKKSGEKKIYKITEPSLVPIKNCIVFFSNFKPENSAVLGLQNVK